MGLSLTDLSERTGLTRAAISRLEKGWNLNPTLETLFRHTEALGVGLKFVVDEPAQPGKDDRVRRRPQAPPGQNKYTSAYIDETGARRRETAPTDKAAGGGTARATKNGVFPRGGGLITPWSRV